MGSVHAFARRVRERLEAQKAAGAVGVKVHPAVQMVRPDHPRAMELYRACGELSLPVFWHCGPVDIETRLGRHLSQVKHYWPAVHGCPGTTFVLGHSGALQSGQGVMLAREYGNVWVELSTLSLPDYRRVLAGAPQDRVMFGSDWPFYHQATALSKALLATEGDDGLRARLLRENAERLFHLDVAALRRRAAGQAR
jgi:predicted TIM-barrel fold metal-dependent hydrolase